MCRGGCSLTHSALPPLAALRFGSTSKEERKRKKKERQNNSKISGHYVRPRTLNVRAHALCSHQNYFFAIEY